MKKTTKVHHSLKKSFDFEVRKWHQANKMVSCGDFGRAMHSLFKVDVASAQHNLVNDIRLSIRQTGDY